MRHTSQYCPIARASELLADRWTLLLMRDLIGGASRFNELARGLPGLSRGLLAARLRQLQRAELIAHQDDRYRPTAKGQAIWPVLEALGRWGAAWTFGDPRAEELDPDLLMWWLHQQVPNHGFPDRRVTVEFDLTDTRSRYWVLITPQDTTLCPQPPGFDTDVTVRSSCSLLYRIWHGTTRTSHHADTPLLELTGPPTLCRAVRAWLDGGPLVPLVEHATMP